MLFLRSPLLGMISLVPNLVPLGLAFGCWALVDGHISMAVAVTMAISFGLIVDDTIYFLHHYQASRRLEGASPAQAVTRAFRLAGSAMVLTSLVLILGFGSAVISALLPTRETVTMLSLIIFFALVADLLLLPPVLLLLERGGGGRRARGGADPAQRGHDGPDRAG